MVSSRRLVLAVVLVVIVVLGSALPALAEDPVSSLTFPAGIACSFGLRIDNFGGEHLVFKQLHDRNGLVYLIQVGKGSKLTYTNLDTGATLWTRANGANGFWTVNPDGSFTQTLTGHNILIMYPTDIPAGPSTTLYVGRVVYTSDSAYNFTLQSWSGTQTDICAALSE